MDNNSQNSGDYLLNELKLGEEKAFDYVFRKYYKLLCSIANGFTSDLQIAENIVQNSFVKFWEHRENLEDVNKLFPYLSKIVRNESIDTIRKEKIRQKVAESVKEDSAEDNVTEYITNKEFEERLLLAISKLPDRCRQAFEYSRLHNMTYAEIAKKMNISVKAVEALISRSLKIIRPELVEFFIWVVGIIFAGEIGE